MTLMKCILVISSYSTLGYGYFIRGLCSIRYYSSICILTSADLSVLIKYKCTIYFFFKPLLNLYVSLYLIYNRSFIKINIIRFWNKLIDLSNGKLTNIFFLRNYNFNRKNWSYEINLFAEEIN